MPENKVATPAQPEPAGPVRLNKALSAAGICSRRSADELISQGKIQVNGQTVTELGVKITPGLDKVEVNGRLVDFQAKEQQNHLYILLNKPPLTVTTMNDPDGRRTVLDLLPGSVRSRRPVPVGRLDCMSEGLLLLTTDGEMTYRLSHPRWHVDKVYRLAIHGPVAAEQLAAMRRGMTLAEGEKLAPVKVRIVASSDQETELEMVLRQGLNRQIRRMCRDLGLQVSWLRRVRQGPLDLGALPEGGWRHVSGPELDALKKQLGLD